MKFIGVRDFRTQSARIWQELGDEKDMIITSNGKPIALLSAISEDNLEESLQVIRQSRAIQAIAQLQSKYRIWIGFKFARNHGVHQHAGKRCGANLA